MARTKAVTLLFCTLLLALLGGLAVLGGLTLAQDAPPEATTQPAEEPSPGPAAGDATAVSNLLAKADSTELTADEHAQLVSGLDTLVSSNIDTPELLRLAKLSGRILTADEKTALRGKILDRVAGTAEKATKLSVDDARQGTVVFDVLNGPSEKGKLALAWMGACETWKTAGPEPLVRFLTALNLAKPEEAAAPRTALVDHVWTTYLAPQADAAKASGPEYAELAIQTHKFLAPEKAKELSTFLVARLSEPKAAAQLSIADIKKVRQTLGSLHNQLDVADVIAAWVASVAQPPSAVAASSQPAQAAISTADIGFLCDQLRPKEGLAGPKAAIAALVENARSRKLLTDPETIIANDPGQWPALARALRNYVTDPERQGMAQLVSVLFVQDRQRTGKLSPVQFADLAEMCGYYVRADLAGQIALIWLEANDLSKLPLDQLALVGAALNNGRAADVGAKKAALGDLVWTAYLSREDFATKTSLEDLTGFVKNVSSALTPAQQAGTADALLRRFAPDAAGLAKLSVNDAIRLAQVLGSLGKPDAAADLIVRWIASGDSWKSAGLFEQQVLAGILKAGNTPDSSAKAVEFALAVYKRQLADLRPGQAPETFTLARLAAFMRALGLTGKDKGHPEFAAALVAAVKGGALAFDANEHQLLALPLGSPEDKTALEQALAGEDGSPRLEAAKVLAWVYKLYATLENWQGTLDAKLAEAELAGDKKALWLLARAYAADPQNYEHGPAPVRKYLDQALLAASSDAGKMAVLRVLAEGAMFEGRFDECLSQLAGFADKFSADEAKSALLSLTDRVAAERLRAYRDKVVSCGRDAELLDATARKQEAAGNTALRDVFLRGADYARKKQAEYAKKVADLGG